MRNVVCDRFSHRLAEILGVVRPPLIVFTAFAVCLFVVATAATASTSVHIDLRGFGRTLGATPGCPDGQTSIPIVHTNRATVECVISARKLSKVGVDPWRVIESVHAKTALADGTIRTAVTETFTFTRSGGSTATFNGRIIGGTGRYAGASGTVSGGGVGRKGVALWHLTFDFR
jgi:hypothetical protein